MYEVTTKWDAIKTSLSLAGVDVALRIDRAVEKCVNVFHNDVEALRIDINKDGFPLQVVYAPNRPLSIEVITLVNLMFGTSLNLDNLLDDEQYKETV